MPDTTDNNVEHKSLLTTKETARELDLKNPHTLEVWRSTKRYPELEYVRVGRCIRYRRSSVERFLQIRTVREGV